MIVFRFVPVKRSVVRRLLALGSAAVTDSGTVKVFRPTVTSKLAEASAD